MTQWPIRFALVFALVFVVHPIVVYLWNLTFPPEGAFNWGPIWWRTFILAFVYALAVTIVLPLVEGRKGKR